MDKTIPRSGTVAATPSDADGAAFPHPASVGSVDHCGLCGRHIAPDEHRVTRVFGKPGSEDVVTQVCRDHLVPSARQRKNLEIVAGTNARAGRGLIEVTPNNQAEANHYRQAFASARREVARERGATVIQFPNRREGRPRERRPRRRSSSSSRTSSNDPGSSDPEPAQLWRWRQPSSWHNLVRSVWTYDVERELAVERDRGEQWLPSHGDVETAAAPPSPPLAQDAWIARRF